MPGKADTSMWAEWSGWLVSASWSDWRNDMPSPSELARQEEEGQEEVEQAIPELAAYGEYFLSRKVVLYTDKAGDEVVGFELTDWGPSAADKFTENFAPPEELSIVVLVPDAITVEMTWDKDIHMFHVSQVMAVVAT